MKIKFNYEMLVSVSALVTAVVAVAVTVFEVRVTREHQKLSVEPYLIIDSTNANGEFAIVLRNQGLGPAKVHSFAVHVDGEPTSGWGEVIEKLTGTKGQFTYASIGYGLQYRAEETVALLHIRDKALAQAFQQHRPDRVRTTLCYCSIYKDCWLFDSDKRVSPAQCPAEPDAGYFGE